MLLTPPVVLTGSGLHDAHDVGSRYLLEGEQVRRVGVLQRRRGGQRVDVVDGCEVRLRCEIAEVHPGRLVLDVLERVVEPAPDVRLVLVQALTMGHPDERGALGGGRDRRPTRPARHEHVDGRAGRGGTARRTTGSVELIGGRHLDGSVPPNPPAHRALPWRHVARAP